MNKHDDECKQSLKVKHCCSHCRCASNAQNCLILGFATSSAAYILLWCVMQSSIPFRFLWDISISLTSKKWKQCYSIWSRLLCLYCSYFLYVYADFHWLAQLWKYVETFSTYATTLSLIQGLLTPPYELMVRKKGGSERTQTAFLGKFGVHSEAQLCALIRSAYTLIVCDFC